MNGVREPSCLRTKLGLLTPEELAQSIGVMPETLREWRHRQYGPDYVKVGKGVMYREQDVASWLEKNVVFVTRV